MNLGCAKLSEKQVKFISRLSLAGVARRYPEDLTRAMDEYPPTVAHDYMIRSKEVVKCIRQQIK